MGNEEREKKKELNEITLGKFSTNLPNCGSTRPFTRMLRYFVLVFVICSAIYGTHAIAKSFILMLEELFFFPNKKLNEGKAYKYAIFFRYTGNSTRIRSKNKKRIFFSSQKWVNKTCRQKWITLFTI